MIKNKVVFSIIIFLSFNSLFALTIPIKINTIISDQKANDNGGNNNLGKSSMAINSDGKYVITWDDFRNDRNDIYAQRYNTNGNLLSENFKVNDTDTLLTSNSYASRVGIAENGSFVIVWAGTDKQDGFLDIYAQRYDAEGNSLGAITRITVHRENNNSDYPDIAMMKNGNYVIVWQKNEDIYAKLFNASGEATSQIILVNDDTEYEFQRRPVVGISENGSFTVAWYDRRDRTSDIMNYDIYAQRFDSTGNKLGSNFKVNDEESSDYNQIDPSIAMDSTGNFIITWRDYRNDPSDIFAQRYDDDGNKIGTNFIVTDDGGSSGQAFPSVSMANDGTYAVAWLDARGGYYSVYAQLYEYPNKMGNNFKIPVSNSGISPHYRPSIKIQDSKITTVWTADDIMYNVLEYSKEYVDTKNISNITTNSVLATGALYRSDYSSQHGFWWNISGDPSLEKDMITLGNADTIGLFSSTISGLHPNTEYYLRAFVANDLEEYKYGDALRFRTLGLPAVSGLSLNEDATSHLQLQANITDLGHPNPTQHGFCWNTTRDPTRADNQARLGSVNSTESFTWTIRGLLNNTHYYARAFVTNSAGTVYSNAVDFTFIETGVENLPTELVLNANFPNPFNPTTTISYQLPTDSDVELSIFDMNGKIITTLIKAYKPSGYHEIKWNASGLNSGIYFYRFTADNYIKTKKMLLMK